MVPLTKKEKQVVAVFTIVAGVLALACLLLGVVATQFDDEAFASPGKLLEMPFVNTHHLRWFMILDMFGYYLLLLPVIFYFHQVLTDKTGWASLLTSLGYGYVLIGAIGAAILAVVWPDLIIQHRQAEPLEQAALASDFILITIAVVKGLWNHLEVLLGGVWWLGVGAYAISNKALKYLTLILGAACIMDGMGELLQLSILAEIGLNIYLLLGIVWSIWTGLHIWNNRL